MENNLENKAKFFAQYWGQLVYREPDFDYLQKVNISVLYEEFEPEELEPNGWLGLKPLSSITDEDSKSLCKSIGLVKAYKRYIGESYLTYVDGAYTVYFYYSGDVKVEKNLHVIADDTISIHNLCLAKGYAVPRMGLSVEKQIEYGWIKLI